jgi:hypothetical protein
MLSTNGTYYNSVPFASPSWHKNHTPITIDSIYTNDAGKAQIDFSITEQYLNLYA